MIAGASVPTKIISLNIRGVSILMSDLMKQGRALAVECFTDQRMNFSGNVFAVLI